jgi:tripartite-type tricarboxylate transporter receptor subunit TctC
VTPPITINPALSKLAYDPIKDFAPVSAVAINGFVLVVNKSFPPKSVSEFVSYVRAQPNKLAYAEGSAGSVTHLAMALFLKRAGLDMTNVSYRGNAPALTDVVAGHLPTMFSNISDAVPQATAGAIRMLGVSTKDRSAQIADVPTIAESGYPGFNVVTWNGLMAPAGTPKEIIDKMAAEIRRAVKDPAFVARLDQMGAEPLGNTPQEFGAMIASETALWADTVKSLGLKF